MSELLETKMEEVCEECTAIEEGVSKNAGKQFIRTPLMIAARDGHILQRSCGMCEIPATRDN